MSWKLVKEIGLEYEPPAKRSDERLALPILLERLEDGSHLVVDVSFSKVLTIAVECRTLRIGQAGKILFDSLACGIGDGYGCAMDGGHIALLRRSAWEIVIVSPDGRLLERLPLWGFTKRMPNVLSWTPRKTFLIAFIDRLFKVDIIEVDAAGRLLWHLPTAERCIGCPSGVQMLPNGNILVADEFCHVAIELNRQGEIVWQYGVNRDPGDRIDRLSSPCSVREIAGRRVIADGRNHRILVLGADGDVQQLAPADGMLTSPTFADLLPDGHCLIADAGNDRVIELDEQGQIVWQYGNRPAARRLFSFPRSIEPVGDALLIADTANNRVVELNHGRIIVCRFSDAKPLFWPRAARRLKSNTTLIADGRNGRVVEVAADGTVLRKIDKLDLDGCPALKDPHDASVLPDGRVLIVDPSSDSVVIADWSGHVSWAAGIDAAVKLKDPHSAQHLADGTVLICDSGNHRLAYVDERGRLVRSEESYCAGGHRIRLNRPRFAQRAADGTTVIVDTGNNRVLAVDERGHHLWTLSDIPDSPIPDLDQPRWAYPLNRDEVLVCDHYHQRFLHLRHEPADAKQ